MYKTLIMPIYDHCDIIYDCLTEKDTDILQKLRNGACRIVLKKKRRTLTIQMHTMEYMYRLVNKLVPEKISTLFKLVSDTHNRTTRAIYGNQICFEYK